MSGKSVAVLFARQDSIYKNFTECDVWDINRDARNYAGNLPVVCHPPCRVWGRLRAFAKPRPDEKDLAFFAVNQVRRCCGVLEHPYLSTLWPAAGLPSPGRVDSFGGWTLALPQFWFGHRADKATWLYIVGCSPDQVPRIPLILGTAPCVVQTRARGAQARPHLCKNEREKTPCRFAEWLVELATICGGVRERRLA